MQSLVAASAKVVGFAFASGQIPIDGDRDDLPTVYEEGFTLANPPELPGPLYLNCSGQKLALEPFAKAMRGEEGSEYGPIEALDLRNTTLSSGETAAQFFDVILRHEVSLKRLYVDNAPWIGFLWIDDWSAPSEENARNYEPLFRKIAFPLADKSETKASFQEICRWVELLCAPPALRGLAFSFFFLRFPQIQKIDCRDFPSEASLVNTFPGDGERKIQDDDLELLLQSIPEPHSHALSFDLSCCLGLSAKALTSLQKHKAKLVHVNLLHNSWVKEASTVRVEALKEIVGLQRRVTEHLTARQFNAWMEMYPSEAGKQKAVEALFVAHPEILTLNFAGSDISKDLLSLVIKGAEKRCKSIDLSNTPQLGCEVLLLLDSCPKLESLNLTGNGWLRDIWTLPSDSFLKVKPLIAKLVYPVQSATGATLAEIYGWRDFLGAKRENFQKACELFFDRFPLARELNCSSHSTTLEEMEVILQAWPYGKNQKEWSGKLDLISPVGVDEGVFPVVRRTVFYVAELYVDETKSMLWSLLIHKLEPTVGATLVSSLALQDGPKEGRATYAMIKQWAWLVGKFVPITELSVFGKCLEWFFRRYELDHLDLSDSDVTLEELGEILGSYRKTKPNSKFSLSLTGCSKLPENGFSVVHEKCAGAQSISLSSLSVSEGSSLANGIQVAHMDRFWRELSFSLRYSVDDGMFLYSDLTRWHALMGDGADWKVACHRFFLRFPELSLFDLEGKSIQIERLSILFESWKGCLQKKEKPISVDISAAELSDDVIENLFLHLSPWVEKINLSHSDWVVDTTLVKLLPFPKLTKIEIEECPHISDEMVGFCEPLLISSGLSDGRGGRRISIDGSSRSNEIVSFPSTELHIKEKRRISVSYRELFPLLQKKDPAASLTSYFLYHPRIERIELSTFDLDEKEFALIAAAWKGASDRWKVKEWSPAVPAEQKDWAERAKTLSLYIGQCKNLGVSCFEQIRDCFEGLSLLDLAGNPWVVNTGLEILEEKAQSLKVQVYGCKNLTLDVAKRLSKVTLIQPYWNTPVPDEGTITFSQIAYHASAPLPPVERGRAVISFFRSVQERVWPEVSSLLGKQEEKTFSLSVANWKEKISYLLPYQREALASLIGKELEKVSTDDEVLDVYRTLSAKIGLTLEEVTEMSTRIHSGEKSASPPDKKNLLKPNIETVVHNLKGEDFVQFFSKVEGIAEACFFLLGWLEGERAIPLRKAVEKEALAAYIALFPRENWDLEPPFVHRAAAFLGFPTLLPDPTSKGDGKRLLRTLADWMEGERFSSFPGRRAELIDSWLTTQTKKMESLLERLVANGAGGDWCEEWAFWTKGYGTPLTEKTVTLEECQRVRQEICLRVMEQREFLYGFSLSENVMRSFPSATNIYLKNGKITPWQLEGIFKASSKRKLALLDLSYNPFLSAEGLERMALMFNPQIQRLQLDGNLWVNDRLVQALGPCVKEYISVERCVHYTPLKGKTSAFIEEEFVRVETAFGFRMSDEQISPQSVHITRIRSLLSSEGNLAEQYWETIVGQTHVFTNISCADSDIGDEELDSLLKALGKALENNEYAAVDLDLSSCTNLTPASFNALVHLREKLSSIKLTRNQWVGIKWLLEDFVPHTKGLRQLHLGGCRNLTPQEIDTFVEAFFAAREGETPGKTLSLTIEVVKVRGQWFPVPLEKGEKYSEKLHSMIAKQIK